MTPPNASAVSIYAASAEAVHPVTAATPQPTKTSTNVPMNSARYFFMISSLSAGFSGNVRIVYANIIIPRS